MWGDTLFCHNAAFVTARKDSFMAETGSVRRWLLISCISVPVNMRGFGKD
jgi:hypothetical protein